ncbi:MAG: putative Ig domain-containing protein [Bacteroidales bacterium]|nr:putative Ig domain-containing protein [Bacteroidales bacterium]
MIKKIVSALLFLSCCLSLAAQQTDYSRYILTPKAPAAPRINGPKVYGNYPGTPFLYKIPATGQRPMTFSAKGLPKGLKLDRNTGIISGKVRKQGTWKVTFTASNARGSDSREFKIVIGGKLCLTPPMGWNSWNCWRRTVSHEKVLSSLNAFIEKGLDQYGWSYINIDDGWQFERRGEDLALQPNSKFPDMKALADSVHKRGLKFGIYSSPWAMCPGGTPGSSACNPEGRYWWIDSGKADEYNAYISTPEDDKVKGSWEKMRYHGRYLFVEQDARQWGRWGVDFLKYDWHPNDYYSIKAMREALDKTGRSIALSLSNRAPIGLGDAYVKLSNSWRTSSDIKDLWESVYRIGFTIMDRWAAYTGPGHWPDADMLEIGSVCDFSKGEGYTRACRLTPDEQYTHMTLWAILCSPLLIGCDLASIDDFTLSLLTNNEVIDVNQDALGYPAARVSESDSTVVYHKPLEDGSLVVALFNISDKPVKMGFKIGELNYMMVEAQTVRDLWRQQDITVLHPGERFEGDAFETEVAPHGCRLLKLSPGLNYNQGIWWEDKQGAPEWIKL